ncbi:LysM peptidoglycan-binding domain-containing protein [Arthrobacter sp. HLT1-21]
MSIIVKGTAGQGQIAGRQAAVFVVGSGLLLGMALPAQAGAVASDPVTGIAATTVSPSNALPAAGAAAEARTYTVSSGDTLGLIGKRHDVSLATILSLNGLSLDSVIYPGDVIVLSAAGGLDNEPTVAAASTATPTAAPTAASAAASASTPSGGIYLASVVESIIYEDEAAPSSVNEAILDAAMAQMGATQDCTVLGEVALRAVGKQGVGDESPESLMTYATPVSTPQPGDFIYYADGGMGFSHNAVYLGNGEAVHSGWNGNQTVIESVDVGSGSMYYRVNG